MNNENKIRYPRKSEFTDKTADITSIKNCEEIYLLYFSESQEYDEKYSFRFTKTISNEIYITPLLQSQFRRSIQYSEPSFFHRRWKDFLRLK